MKDVVGPNHYSEDTGKLHVKCPHSNKSGVKVHVVVRNGVCYRSKECLVVQCKFNDLQNDLDSLLSITW